MTVDVASQIKILPWSWSGWAESFSKLRNLESDIFFLTAVALPKLAADELKNLQNYKIIFVDFFPDEISLQEWQKIEKHTAKMVFLPPFARLPAHIGPRREKSVLISDRQIQGLPLPEVPEAEKKNWPPGYAPRDVPFKLLAPALDSKIISSAEDLCDVINAPAWVLYVSDAQTEHALYLLASRYGLRISFWERVYSSPLRALVGYEDAFDTFRDKNLRERFRRARKQSASHTSPENKPPQTEWTLDEVRSRFSYRALGLDKPAPYPKYPPYLDAADRMLPQAFAPVLHRPQGWEGFQVVASKILNRSREHATDALLERLWKILVMDLLFSENVAAMHSWARLCELKPRWTQEITFEFLKTAAPWELFEMSWRILWSVFYYNFRPPGFENIFALIYSRHEEWLDTPNAPPWYCTLKGMLEIMKGQAPQNFLKSFEIPEPQHGDLWLLYGIWMEQQGVSAAAATAFEKGIACGSLVQPALRIALDLTFTQSHPSFDKLFDAAVEIWGVKGAIENTMAQQWHFASDATWRQKAMAPVEKMLTRLAEFDAQKLKLNGLQIFLMVCVGRCDEAIELYQKLRANHKDKKNIFATLETWAHGPAAGPEALIWALFLYYQGRTDEPMEIFKQVDAALLNEDMLAFYAALGFVFAQAEVANETLKTLQQKNPYFWRTNIFAPSFELKASILGMLSRATGDEALQEKLQPWFELPSLSKQRTQIAAIKKILPAEALDSQLRVWIWETI